MIPLVAKLNKFHFYLLCALACFPVLNIKSVNILIIAFVSLSLGIGFYNYKKLNARNLWFLLLQTSLFFIIFIWSFIFDRSKEAFFYTEKSMSLLVFPLAYYFSPIQNNEKLKRWFYICFIGSTLMSVIYGLVSVGFLFNEHLGVDKFWKNTHELFNDPSYSYLLRTNFEIFTNSHPTYACLLLGVSFIFLFKITLSTYKRISRNMRILYALLLAILLFLQVILAARTPFIATIVASFVLFVLYQRSKKRILIFIAGAIVLSTLFLAVIPSFSARFNEVSISNLSKPSASNQNSFNIRTGIYDCSFEIIKKNWLFGVGPGHLQTELNQCYNNISKEVYQNQNYNTHNQFLDYWAAMGFLAPLLLLANLIFLSIINFRQKQFVAISLCVFFFICMSTENILLRHSGIVPFALILGLFSYNSVESS